MEGLSLLICKDIIEKHWIEFLTYLKQKEQEQKENRQKQRLDAIKRLASNCDEPTYGLVSTEIEQYYGSLDAYSFWRWYMQEKISLDKPKTEK